MTKSMPANPADIAVPSRTVSSETDAFRRIADSHGRTVDYLRLSVTDRCNLRCMYCWSSEHMQFLQHNDILTYEEILRLVDLVVEMGISKIRLTGGEPFARKNILHLIEQMLMRHPHLDLRLTTNATLLSGKVQALKDAGVRCLNISLDTFNRQKFQHITGRDMLRNVTRAIDEALALDMHVKLNAVALKGINDDELPVFINFAKRNPVDVRFIEFMPMGNCNRWTQDNFWSAADILAAAREYVELTALGAGERKSGPARLYGIEGGKGRLGVISPMSNHFCNDCNRLRITSDGRLRTCLFSDKEYSLRPLLRNPKLGERFIRTVLERANSRKPLGYKILQKMREHTVADKRMNAIGG